MDKRRKENIYVLMDKFLKEDIDAQYFSDKFHEYYNLYLDLSHISNRERELFDELNNISSRLAISEEEYKKYPGVYFSNDDLTRKILEIKSELN